MKPWVCIGKIIAAHGIKGQVKIRVFDHNPEELTTFGQLVNKKQEPILIKSLSVISPTTIIATLEGVTTRNQSELLKGTEVFVHQDHLPSPSQEEALAEQLIGLPVLADGKTIGKVIGVYNFGAGSFCEVQSDGGKIGTVHLSSCAIHGDRLECPLEHFLI